MIASIEYIVLINTAFSHAAGRFKVRTEFNIGVQKIWYS